MTSVWPALRYDDAGAALRFLVDGLGFTTHAVYDGADGDVAHAELLWPGGGGVMLGSGGELAMARGGTTTYLVTEDVDAVVERAVAHGGKLVQPVRDEDYGGRGGTVADAEGNLWSVGSYRPAV
jgi:uncharacterized glyoxalase superfamily protein PhnB